MTDATPPLRTAQEILSSYDAVLLDSYGVLVDGAGALPGARAFLQALQARCTPWLVVSNDASRSVAASAERYASLRLPVPPDRILVSAALLAGHFARNDLAGAETIVLGPQDSVAWVRQAGGVVVPWDHPDPAVVVVCDDAGYPFVPAVEAIVTTLSRKLRAGDSVHLVLPNPDLIYPDGQGRLALTAGTTAGVIEAALHSVFGDAAPRFARLGKPHGAIFEAACARLGLSGRRVVMLGDQIVTDVAGGRAAGLSTGLVCTGVTAPNVEAFADRPDFIVRSLA